MDLLQVIKKHLVKERRGRYRDRRGHYASSALQDMRDQYWSLIGVPETNPTDFIGRMKMLVGTAVETELVKALLGDLHWYGIHLVGTQVTVGGSSPAWDGALDALVTERNEDGTFNNYVVEIKTKSGYGADLLSESMEPSDEYLAQLGLYLKDLSSKGITDKGCLLYVLLSDRHFGEIVQIDCRYDKETDELVAYKGSNSVGGLKQLNFRLKIGQIEERWKQLDEYVAKKECPPGEYQYKTPITQQLLESLSDDKLRKMINGELVVGPWQPKYSRYRDLQLQTDNVSPQYTEDEITQIRSYYRKIHPKSKL